MVLRLNLVAADPAASLLLGTSSAVNEFALPDIGRFSRKSGHIAKRAACATTKYGGQTLDRGT